MHLVLGLGNPGRRYAQTRHNAGFLVVDRLASRDGATVERKQLGALVERVQVRGQPAMVAKPQSYMNRSGQPAASLRGYYKVVPTDVVVVHDEVDLPFGTVRVKRGGGHGGHNGLRDLIASLGADFVRVRVGVGRPPAGWETADYVLGTWTDSEQSGLDEVVDLAADAVTLVVADGPQAAMNQINRRAEARDRTEGPGAPADPSAGPDPS